MALKKSDLYSSLWAACDDLRGPMEPSQYKDYVLVLLFIKYISDKYTGKKYAPIQIPSGASFADLVALKGKSDIGDLINTTIIAPLIKANNLADMPDFNDPSKLGAGKEMVDRLTNLISLFEDSRLDFSKNRADGDDILGDAYEYLMRHFATQSGKSKGQFYTPSEVSRIMARLIGIDNSRTSNETTVYDPTCGSGSLLLKVADEGSRVSGAKVSLYGQENEATTAGLARMNMILHDNPTAEIRQGNTITTPHFKDGAGLKTFDYVVANPPFSDKRWSTGLNVDNDYGRFIHFGRPPAKQGDYAYLLHIIASLKTTGRGACILPHGVLFRGNAEAVIRRNLIQDGLIQAIIGLPSNLFFGTNIAACLVIIDKNDAAARKAIFMVDASSGFVKDGAKNRLREQDIHRIVDIFQQQMHVPGYARLVPISEIADPKNDYNLNIPRYIDSVQREEMQDITAHMSGGIPERDIESLSEYWDVMPNLRSELFGPFGRDGYEELRVAVSKVRSVIAAHPEFEKFRSTADHLFLEWRIQNELSLRSLTIGSSPKEAITKLSESLLLTFKNIGLLDAYDLYQGLMEYWSETFQDDAYMISIDDWIAAVKPREIVQQKDKNNKSVWAEDHDFSVGKRRFKSDLLPASILVNTYFSLERAALDELIFQQDSVEPALESEREEHAVEGGLLEEVAEFADDKVKIVARDVNKWLRNNAGDQELSDEFEAVTRLMDLLASQAALKVSIKEVSLDLDAKIAAKYSQLTEAETKDLVVGEKWFSHFESIVASALKAAEAKLNSKILDLQMRYEIPVSALEAAWNERAAKVAEHIASMGVS